MNLPEFNNDLLFMGVQGSGKGTQAKILHDEYEVVEAGALLRQLGKADTDLGRQIAECQRKGILVPDELMAQMLEQQLLSRSPEDRVILDGYPRTVPQMDKLNQMMSEQDRDFTAIHFELSREEATARMLARNRADDTPDVIERRLDLFEQNTVPVINQYRDEGRLIDIDASQSPAEVADEIQRKLQQQFQSRTYSR